MRHLGKRTSKFLTYALFAVIFTTPYLTLAQVGYGGGGGGGGTIGLPYTGPLFTSTPGGNNPPGVVFPLGNVLGASAFNFAKNLSFGMSGEDVIELQNILIAEGFLKLSEPTGFFGRVTETAVKAYQTAHGLEAVGIVGPLTRAFLNKGVSPSAPTGSLPAPVTKEDRETLIKDLQQKVEELRTKIQTLLGMR